MMYQLRSVLNSSDGPKSYHIADNDNVALLMQLASSKVLQENLVWRAKSGEIRSQKAQTKNTGMVVSFIIKPK